MISLIKEEKRKVKPAQKRKPEVNAGQEKLPKIKKQYVTVISIHDYIRNLKRIIFLF